MTQTVIALFAFFLAFSQKLHAEIKEIQSTQEIWAHVEPETLLIFDMDNTLIEPKQMLGSEAWFDRHRKELISRGASADQAMTEALTLWGQIQRVTKVRAVESNTARGIKKLQQSGIQLMLLTGRPVDLMATTGKQLKSVGIDFRVNPVWKYPVHIKALEHARYEDGMLLSGVKNTKAQVLQEFFAKISWLPKRVVFVDEKLKHLLGVGEAMAEAGVPFLGLRYAASDSHAERYDHSIALVQQKFFFEILDDKQAELLGR